MRAEKRDESESDIVAALEKAGFQVWRRLPCDLLTYRVDKGFRTLECKTPDHKGRRQKRNDQAAQDTFLVLTGTPVVMTPEQALRELGAVPSV